MNRFNINLNGYYNPVIDYYNPVIVYYNPVMDYYNPLPWFEPCLHQLGLTINQININPNIRSINRLL